MNAQSGAGSVVKLMVSPKPHWWALIWTMVRIKGVVSVIWRWYTGKLDSRPLITQAVTTGMSYVLGSVACQARTNQQVLYVG